MKGAKVAIVGSGVAGATVASILLDRGAAGHVTMFEAGPALQMADYRKWVDFLTTEVRPYKHCEDLPADTTGDTGAFQVAGGRLFVVGGSTVHWGGWCPRFKPEDFALKSATGQGLDWPFTYDELAPYYAKAEVRLRVSGDATRDDPPRHGATFPMPAVPLTQKDRPVMDALSRLGYGGYGSMSIARNERCQTTGTCKYCPVNGKYDATMDLQAIKANFTLKPGSPVLSITMKNKRQAEGLRYVDKATGEEKEEVFDEIIVCAGTIESAKILLASRSAYWPAGLGNDTGHVGRHLISHPRIQGIGAFASNPRAYTQELDFPTLECRHFDSPDEQKKGGKFFFVRDCRENRLRIAAELIAGKRFEDVQNALVGPMKFTLSGFVEEYESPENRVELAPGKSRFGLPLSRITYKTPQITKDAKLRHIEHMAGILREMGAASFEGKVEDTPRSDHAAATCRMSKKAIDGVVDHNLRIHECDNVCVCSNAVLPNIAAVNPTLTLVALAIRFAETV